MQSAGTSILCRVTLVSVTRKPEYEEEGVVEYLPIKLLSGVNIHLQESQFLGRPQWHCTYLNMSFSDFLFCTVLQKCAMDIFQRISRIS